MMANWRMEASQPIFPRAPLMSDSMTKLDDKA